MRVWPVWNPVTLFLGTQNGAATTKNNIAFTQPIKKKNRATDFILLCVDIQFFPALVVEETVLSYAEVLAPMSKIHWPGRVVLGSEGKLPPVMHV